MYNNCYSLARVWAACGLHRQKNSHLSLPNTFAVVL